MCIGIKYQLTLFFHCLFSESPRIQPFNLATHFRTGDKVTILCAIKSGSPPFHFSWLKNSHTLNKEEAAEVIQLKEFSNLILPPLTLASRGNYTCHVKNNYGSDSHTEHLNVVGEYFYAILSSQI